MARNTEKKVGPADAPDRYTLVRRISSGGEGDLWEATVKVGDGSLPVAIKALRPVPGVSLEESVQRISDQAEILKSLEHPGIVKVREAFAGSAIDDQPGDDDSRSLYIVMNFVPGQDLNAWVQENPDRDVLTVSRIVSGLAAALSHLHSGTSTGGTPVLHRDIKPANVIMSPNGQATLVDFGLARLASPHALTIVGTPQYFAPEVISGLAPDEASDRYGLGAVTYFLFTGEAPVATDPAATRARLLQVDGITDREGFADHVMAMLSSDPARRPTDVVTWSQGLAMGTVSGRFGQAQYGGAIATKKESRRGLLVAIGIVAAVVLGGGAVYAATSSGGFNNVFAGSSANELGDLVGMTVDEAEAALLELDIVPEIVYEPHDGPEGIVLAQDPSPGTVDPIAVTLTVSSPIIPIEMPDLVGSTLAEARAELALLGIVPEIVFEPSGETPGIVLSQSPAPMSLDPVGVTLTISEEPTTIPDVTGLSLNQALTALEALGIIVTTVDVLNENVPDGQVVLQLPEGGSVFVDEVQLTVARQPVITFLSDQAPVQGSVSTGTANVSGNAYTRSVWFSWGRFSGSSSSMAGYDLGRDYREFRTTLGILDNADSATRMKFEIYGDGRLLHESTLSFGDTREVSVDVTGVLRLELRATPLTSSTVRSAVFADARILGTADEVTAAS